ncbi:MAG: tRNA-dihydrouridine synthase [bacterium]
MGLYRKLNIHNLTSPVIALSPMDGVTDFAYREIAKKYGHVDLLYTEFVNVHGLSLGVESLINELMYSEFQRPILSQIYGHEIEYFYPAALVCLFLGFDGIDINMGCPAKKVSDRGAGAGLICNPESAKKIILEVKKAREDFTSEFKVKEILSIDNLSAEYITEVIVRLIENHNPELLPSIKPIRLGRNIFEKLKNWNLNIKYIFSNERLNNLTVSVKTRIGYDSDIVDKWIPSISESSPDFIAIHGRTLKQMYTGSASWESISKAISTLKELGKDILVFANGDIKTKDDAKKCLQITKADGILIGRGSYGNPWIFEDIRNSIIESKSDTPLDIRTMEDIRKLLLDHSEVFVKAKGEERFFEMRKNLAWAISGIPNASEVRSKLVRCNTLSELKTILTTI